MRSLAVILLSVCTLGKTDNDTLRLLSEVREFNSTGLQVLGNSSRDLMILGVEECESEVGLRCVHFTECDEEGLVVDQASTGSQLLGVRFGSDDGLSCPGEMEICCREREQIISKSKLNISMVTPLPPPGCPPSR